MLFFQCTLESQVDDNIYGHFWSTHKSIDFYSLPYDVSAKIYPSNLEKVFWPRSGWRRQVWILGDVDTQKEGIQSVSKAWNQSNMSASPTSFPLISLDNLFQRVSLKVNQQKGLNPTK